MEWQPRSTAPERQPDNVIIGYWNAGQWLIYPPIGPQAWLAFRQTTTFDGPVPPAWWLVLPAPPPEDRH